MNRWLKIAIANILVLVIVVGGFGLLALYLYDKSHYITTDDARVSANTINITAASAGKITSWTVKPGDKVSGDSAIGTQQAIVLTPSAASGGKPAISTRLVQNTSGTPGSSPGTTPPATGGTPAPSGGTASQPNAAATPPAPTAGGAAAQSSPARLDIRAPISGTIIQNVVEPGQTVAPGQPLAMIADLNKVFIVANIEETRIKDVSTGQSVDITLDAFPGDTFSGKVVSVIRATASTFSMIPTGTTSGSYTKVVQKIPVQISLDTAGKEILPGMSASVRIQK